jgi:putative SOS response-associated peptidase YedK
MCGRFAFYSPREAVQSVFGIDPEFELQPRYNITPSQDIAAFTAASGGQPEFAFLRWGLVPFWAKDPAIGQQMINARAETLREKPSFRTAIKRSRCVILADGYYEWQRTESGKLPHYFTSALNSPMLLAGLWDTWEKGSEPLRSCAIITHSASPAIAAVHHRMPLILSEGSARRWLDAGSDTATVDGLLQEQTELEFWPVSKNVNSPKNQGPDLIQRVD